MFRIITCLWPNIHPKPTSTLLLCGGVVELSRHFPCAWNSWSFDIHTERAYICLSPDYKPIALGAGCREVGFWWGLWSPLRGITIHAGFICVLSLRLCADDRARSLAALEHASITKAEA
jgi:hypothetical protein